MKKKKKYLQASEEKGKKGRAYIHVTRKREGRKGFEEEEDDVRKGWDGR
jgi:hypothetical protein